MIVHSATSTPACPSCGDRCQDCGDRMCSRFGPEPLPRCPEHPCCVDCDGPVYCSECGLAIAERAQDRAADLAYDVAREARHGL